MNLQDNAESARTKSRKGSIVGMKRIGLASVAVAAALIASGAQLQAGITNGSFETGTLVGWTPAVSGGTVTVVTSKVALYDSSQTWLPTDGTYFAYLNTGESPLQFAMLSQAFSAIAGDVLKFDVFFDTNDTSTTPPPDHGYVNLIDAADPGNPISLYSQFSPTHNGWTPISTALTAGHTYTIEAGVFSFGSDDAFSSALGLDNVRIVNDTPPPGGVPEPMSLVIWGIGGVVMMVSAARRRRQQNAV